ncbi:hypothetical protein BpHYR1_036126 [Brachionus plicatilis]|uniref:Uncharacterized protein n=1 Tax=Brachionus plicatilis TaxID=10195 RepID=A0A3M7S5B1_BRAPC|nr:hypothetical protein BpHYR1_036126 [Brachionus plicatilis]
MTSIEKKISKLYNKFFLDLSSGRTLGSLEFATFFGIHVVNGFNNEKKSKLKIVLKEEKKFRRCAVPVNKQDANIQLYRD